MASSGLHVLKSNFKTELAYELTLDEDGDRLLQAIAKFYYQPEMEISDLNEMNFATGRQITG